MCKLLSAGFMRLWKNKCFWICIIFMTALGVIIPASQYHNMVKYDALVNLDGTFFGYAMFIGLVSSVFVSLFVGTEYSDGTIRNKVIAGHKRAAVYLANLVLCICAGFLMCGAYMTAHLIVGIPLLGFFALNAKILLLVLVTAFLLSAAMSSILTMISMLNQSKALGVVACMLCAGFLLFAGAYIYSRLGEPEVYPGYLSMVDGVFQEGGEYPNPNYLRGTEREIYAFLNDFLPGGQANQCASLELAHPLRLSLYSCVIVILSTGAGLICFRRKDLK